MSVLVFDSGVGALSIIDEIRQQLPDLSITYASDNDFFPYGSKSEDELVERVDRVLHALVEQRPPELIVVACNTASTVALPRIRSHFRMPIVGVVPAIKPAAQVSRSRIIGLLATPGTVRRAYTRKLIEDFAADCKIIAVGSGRLVELAEQKLRGETPAEDDLRLALEGLLKAPDFEGMDTVVLACTHFPLLKPELQRILARPVQWVDSGEAIARRVAHLLRDVPPASEPASFCSIFTGDKPALIPLRRQLQAFLPGPLFHLELSTGELHPLMRGDAQP